MQAKQPTTQAEKSQQLGPTSGLPIQSSAASLTPIKKFFILFLCGLLDSISLHWLPKILFVTHPTTKKIHPLSLQLLRTFKNTLVQVCVFLIGMPYLCRYFGYEMLGTLVSGLFLALTYGYLFFYNTQIMDATKKVALWSCKFPNSNFCQFDNREKVQLFYSLSNQVKSFIFLLLYYTPIFMTCLILSSLHEPTGTLLLLISQSFFNGCFYFLKKWPYDRYNVAFLERNVAYMIGYGFVISVLCNVVLSGEVSRGAYFVGSQWLIVNCLLYSPPQLNKLSIDTTKNKKWLANAWQSISKLQNRIKLGNAYNVHRKFIRKDKNYRQNLLQNLIILKPALKITEWLNSFLAKKLGSNLDLNIGNTTELISSESLKPKQKQDSGSISTAVSSNMNASNQKSLQIVSQLYEAEAEAQTQDNAQKPNKYSADKQ